MSHHLFFVFLFILLGFVQAPDLNARQSTMTSINSSKKIAPYLLQQMKQGSRGEGFDALIYLTTTATESLDFDAHRSFASREERIRYVYSTLTRNAKTSQQNLIKMLAEAKVSYRSYYITNVIAIYSAPRSVIEAIAKRSDVSRIYGDPKFSPIPKMSDSFSEWDIFKTRGIEANIVHTGATKVWDELGVQGEGIVVAGQDTGYEWDHPSLKEHYRGYSKTGTNHQYSWHNSIYKETSVVGQDACASNYAVPCDDHDHGTHTMGTMIGDDNKGNRIGMAPKAKWIGCRNMLAGTGRPSTYLECFEWFLAPYPQGQDKFTTGNPAMAPHVINNSWGCDQSEGCVGDEFLEALKVLKAAGIMVVVSAGNEGSSCSTIKSGPAYHTDEVLSVGALDHRNNNIANFSSRGPSTFDGKLGPHVSAPGVSVRSSVRGGKYSGFMWSGTSMAGPHVAGAVALLWSAVPELIGKVEETKTLLQGMAVPRTTTQSCGGVAGSMIPNNTYGYGMLDIYNAIKQHQ